MRFLAQRLDHASERLTLTLTPTEATQMKQIVSEEIPKVQQAIQTVETMLSDSGAAQITSQSYDLQNISINLFDLIR